MRLWDSLPAAPPTPLTQREYEVVGYVIQGCAKLEIEGQSLWLEAGDSWVVPRARIIGTKSSSHLRPLRRLPHRPRFTAGTNPEKGRT